MKKFKINNIPAVVYGDASEKVFLFIHGKNGNKEEAEKFAAVGCQRGYQVLSFDLPEHGERQDETGTFNPWNAVPEFRTVLTYAKNRWEDLSIRANSIGAYFAMLSYAGEDISRCLFVSPILDLEKLIANMMIWSGVTEDRLKEEKIIRTEFGETLSWEYLNYVRDHRITQWNTPTFILYGTADNLTDRPTLDAFTGRFHCKLTVMDGGEHWFHTPEQLEILEKWTKDSVPY